MRSTIIHETRRFVCISYGNGLAYALEMRSKRDSILLQGDDATAFRKELDNLTGRRLKLSYDEALGVLWDDYGPAADAGPLLRSVK